MPITPQQFEEMKRRVNRAPVVQSPARTTNAVELERDLHDDFESYLIEHGYLYVHSRMDVPSTIAVGHPDFTVFMPGARTCFLEFKARGTKTTTKQLEKLAHARKLGFVAEIVDNMPDALAVLARAQVNH